MNKKARHDWLGKVIHWEMCKKFKFEYANKWYMHNPAPVLENDTQKLFWDFDIQTDHLISARRRDLIIINRKKKICKIVDFVVPADHRINLKECEKRDKYLNLARELEKNMEQLKPLQFRVDLGVIAMKEQSSLSRSPRCPNQFTLISGAPTCVCVCVGGACTRLD